MASPRVIIGVPLYNHEAEFREALESLLSQTFRDFRLVLVDDCSTDGTEAVARAYAALDPRVIYERNDRRLGMIDNWRRAFEVTQARFPDARYFAWASDHDIWHPRWLAALVDVLDRQPEVVLAYPLNRRVGPDGEMTDKRPWEFDTSGVTDLTRRFKLTLRYMSAGNMIYGLCRVEAITRAGVFRRVLVPDRLLLMELALQGEFRQVPEILWFRRWFGRIFSLRRQRRSFFPQGRPLYAYVPWWISHAVTLGWVLTVRGEGPAGLGRARGLLLALRYLWLAGLFHARQQLRGWRYEILERATFLKPAYHWWRRVYRATLRRLGFDVMTRKYHTSLKGAGKRARLVKRWRKQLGRAARSATRRPGILLLKSVRALPLMQGRVIPWLLRQEIDQIPSAREVGLMRRELRSIARSRHPIVVGPWLSEVGFEVLYWIPFLTWVAREFKLEPERLVVISRGGAGAWYRDLAGRYVDIFDLMSVKEFRKRNETRWADEGVQKQMAASEFDEHIVRLARERLGLGEVSLLHPSVMYRLLRYYWYEKGAVSLLQKHTVYRPFPALDASDVVKSLPQDYYAVRFYFRPSFPDTLENRATVGRVIRTLAEQAPVVLLNTGLSVDDHEDFDPGTGMGIHKIDHLMKPNANLEVQSAVISRARAFVGTYGGLAYLGPYYGVPSVALYSDDTELVQAHLDVSKRYTRTLGTPLVMLHTREVDLVSAVLGARGGQPVPAGGPDPSRSASVR